MLVKCTRSLFDAPAVSEKPAVPITILRTCLTKTRLPARVTKCLSETLICSVRLARCVSNAVR